jgi:hypothetical protein
MILKTNMTRYTKQWVSGDNSTFTLEKIAPESYQMTMNGEQIPLKTWIDFDRSAIVLEGTSANGGGQFKVEIETNKNKATLVFNGTNKIFLLAG